MIPIPKPSVGEKLLMNAAVITCTGQYQLYIENYKTVQSLTEKRVEVQTKTCLVIVEGIDLMASYYTKEEMKITGRIQNIQYVER